MLKSLSAICAALALCAGCATPSELGRKADTLRPGVSTSSEAITLMGPPKSVSSMADGGRLLQWIEVKPGLLNATSGHVAILFNGADKMVRVTHRYDSEGR